jgi:polar amino acid transport system substrate-binding protein
MDSRSTSTDLTAEGRTGSAGRPVLTVGAALPDPPFELGTAAGPVGFDIEVMRLVAEDLGRDHVHVPYDGDDFDGIFAGLDRGDYDVVASGATITEHRRTLALFCRPYVHSGQSLVVDTRRHPDIHGVDGLVGRTVGVQRGNTSEPVVDELHRSGRLGAVRRYAYHDIHAALDDVVAGEIDGFMKLEPVMRWLTADRRSLAVVETGITREELGVAVRLDDHPLASSVDAALDRLRQDGTLDRLGRKWLHTDRPGTGTRIPR